MGVAGEGGGRGGRGAGVRVDDKGKQFSFTGFCFTSSASENFPVVLRKLKGKCTLYSEDNVVLSKILWPSYFRNLAGYAW
jgi:hypothetical protein